MKHTPTSGRHICAEKDARVRVAELKEGGGPLGLLLLPVDAHHRQVDVVEQLVVELDGHARGEEDHHLGTGFISHCCLASQSRRPEICLG